MVSVTMGVAPTAALAGRLNDPHGPEFPPTSASVQVVSVGRPVTVKLTTAGKGAFAVVGVSVNVVIAVLPRVTVCEGGFAAIPKSEPTPNVTGLLVPPAVFTVKFALLTNGAAGIVKVAVIIVLLATTMLLTAMFTPGVVL
jgi:hypothetical protein